jgi:hypothetical protein
MPAPPLPRRPSNEVVSTGSCRLLRAGPAKHTYYGYGGRSRDRADMKT